MTEIALIHHGLTEWNASHRLQRASRRPIERRRAKQSGAMDHPSGTQKFRLGGKLPAASNANRAPAGAGEIAPEPALIEMH